MSVAARLKLAVIALLALAPFPIFYPIQLVLVRTRYGGLIPMYYWRYLLALIGVRVVVRGVPASGRPLLLVANHVSWIDIAIVGSRFPLSFIAKAEVGRWPVIGHLSRLQRTLYVDRERRTATAAANREMAERLASGDALVLFAEGTSSAGLRVLPFRSSLLGGVRDAIRRAGVTRSIPVQPLAICYRGYRGLPIDRWRRPRYAWYGDMELAPHAGPLLTDGVIEVELAFGEPVDYAEDTDRKRLARDLEGEVSDMLAEAVTGRSPADRAAAAMRAH
jgi:1-acyl-sn-glycerol-3-phosphate acyltransferase